MRDIRISVAVITTILIVFGVVMIFSASGVYAIQQLGSSTYYLSRHLLFLAVGFILTLSVMAVDYRKLQPLAKPLLLVMIFLLVLVLIPGIGKQSFGARRWFRVFGFSVQPSEFIKLAVLIYLADFLSRKQNKVHDFYEGFLPILFMLAIVCLPILKQPDLGTSVFIAAVALIVLFVAGTRPIFIGGLVLLALPFMYLLVARVPYRMARIMLPVTEILPRALCAIMSARTCAPGATPSNPSTPNRV